MQWLSVAFEFVTTVGLGLGLDRVSTLRPWWLRLATIVLGLTVALILAFGLVLAGAFVVGLVTAPVR